MDLYKSTCINDISLDRMNVKGHALIKSALARNINVWDELFCRIKVIEDRIEVNEDA